MGQRRPAATRSLWLDPAWRLTFVKAKGEGHEGNEEHEEEQRQLLEHGNARSHRGHDKVNGNSWDADDADRADERATAIAFVVGVAREPRRREANKSVAVDLSVASVASVRFRVQSLQSIRSLGAIR